MQSVHGCALAEEPSGLELGLPGSGCLAGDCAHEASQLGGGSLVQLGPVIVERRHGTHGGFAGRGSSSSPSAAATTTGVARRRSSRASSTVRAGEHEQDQREREVQAARLAPEDIHRADAGDAAAGSRGLSTPPAPPPPGAVPPVLAATAVLARQFALARRGRRGGRGERPAAAVFGASQRSWTVVGGAQPPPLASVRSRLSPLRSSRATRRTEMSSFRATPPRDRGGPAPTPARSKSTRRCAVGSSLRQPLALHDGLAQLALALGGLALAGLLGAAACAARTLGRVERARLVRRVAAAVDDRRSDAATSRAARAAARARRSRRRTPDAEPPRAARPRSSPDATRAARRERAEPPAPPPPPDRRSRGRRAGHGIGTGRSARDGTAVGRAGARSARHAAGRDDRAAPGEAGAATPPRQPPSARSRRWTTTAAGRRVTRRRCPRAGRSPAPATLEPRSAGQPRPSRDRTVAADACTRTVGSDALHGRHRHRAPGRSARGRPCAFTRGAGSGTASTLGTGTGASAESRTGTAADARVARVAAIVTTRSPSPDAATARREATASMRPSTPEWSSEKHCAQAPEGVVDLRGR